MFRGEKTFSVRKSESGDTEQLKSLWRMVFRDSEELIQGFFSLFRAEKNAAVAETGGKIISAGYLLTGAEARGEKCAYIYAMATLPEYRNRGAGSSVALALRDAAFAGGQDILAVLPADMPLCGWYRNILGAEPAFKKGGDGVVFHENWLKFARLCGEHSGDTPPRLLAVRRDGRDVGDLRDMGWECCFD